MSELPEMYMKMAELKDDLIQCETHRSLYEQELTKFRLKICKGSPRTNSATTEINKRICYLYEIKKVCNKKADFFYKKLKKYDMEIAKCEDMLQRIQTFREAYEIGNFGKILEKQKYVDPLTENNIKKRISPENLELIKIPSAYFDNHLKRDVCRIPGNELKKLGQNAGVSFENLWAPSSANKTFANLNMNIEEKNKDLITLNDRTPEQNTSKDILTLSEENSSLNQSEINPSSPTLNNISSPRESEENSSPDQVEIQATAPALENISSPDVPERNPPRRRSRRERVTRPEIAAIKNVFDLKQFILATTDMAVLEDLCSCEPTFFTGEETIWEVKECMSLLKRRLRNMPIDPAEFNVIPSPSSPGEPENMPLAQNEIQASSPANSSPDEPAKNSPVDQEEDKASSPELKNNSSPGEPEPPLAQGEIQALSPANSPGELEKNSPLAQDEIQASSSANSPGELEKNSPPSQSNAISETKDVASLKELILSTRDPAVLDEICHCDPSYFSGDELSWQVKECSNRLLKRKLRAREEAELRETRRLNDEKLRKESQEQSKDSQLINAEKQNEKANNEPPTDDNNALGNNINQETDGKKERDIWVMIEKVNSEAINEDIDDIEEVMGKKLKISYCEDNQIYQNGSTSLLNEKPTDKVLNLDKSPKAPINEKKMELVSQFDNRDDENSTSESSSDFWDLDGEKKSTKKSTTEFNLNKKEKTSETQFKESNKNISQEQKKTSSDSSSQSSDDSKPANGLAAQLFKLNIGIGNFFTGGLFKNQETESEVSEKQTPSGPAKEEESDFEF